MLYTHQKTKKRKSWKEGRLALPGTSASLYDACPNWGSAWTVVNAVDLSGKEARALANRRCSVDFLESEKFLIQVEGPWVADGGSDGNAGGNDHPLWNKRPLASGRNPRPSNKMRKVLATKSKLPSRIQPVHLEENRPRA